MARPKKKKKDKEDIEDEDGNGDDCVPLSWSEVLRILAKPNRDKNDVLPCDFNGVGCECTPTDATPGSPEKVAVMEYRYSLRQKLFHRHDGKINLQ